MKLRIPLFYILTLLNGNISKHFVLSNVGIMSFFSTNVLFEGVSYGI